MAADDLEYGWYKWENGFRQKDGFFVDRNGNVLFWPSRKGPGFLLDPREIPRLRETLGKAGPLFSWRLAFLCLALVYPAFKQLLRSSGAPDDSLPYILAWCAALAILLGVWLVQRPRWQDLELWSRPKRTGPRPPVRDVLIVAKALSDAGFWGRILLFATVASVCGYFFTVCIGEAVTGEPSKLFGTLAPYISALDALIFVLCASYAVSYLAALLWARSSPYSLDDLVSRIKEREGLTFRALLRETDSDVTPEEERQREARWKALNEAYRKRPGT